ncbi:SHOCT domain-containing protein [Dactylosporangium sp. NBC_01737]|uniref:SHOCT domain-containing protein n=1 Tax=Dactylosporangium sp. NBC_01737 TaxID=2975959 RepID=UPI002E141678|nr:SHOCT domain-containing protein [Dactylosporangium sp. NBC_01737]
MYWGNGMGGWGMLFMSVSGLLFWGLIIAGVVVLARSMGYIGRPRPAGGQTPAPQQVLADRFARGEIDDEEYTRRLQVLRTAPGGHGPGG